MMSIQAHPAFQPTFKSITILNPTNQYMQPNLQQQNKELIYKNPNIGNTPQIIQINDAAKRYRTPIQVKQKFVNGINTTPIKTFNTLTAYNPPKQPLNQNYFTRTFTNQNKVNNLNIINPVVNRTVNKLSNNPTLINGSYNNHNIVNNMAINQNLVNTINSIKSQNVIKKIPNGQNVIINNFNNNANSISIIPVPKVINSNIIKNPNMINGMVVNQNTIKSINGTPPNINLAINNSINPLVKPANNNISVIPKMNIGNNPNNTNISIIPKVEIANSPKNTNISIIPKVIENNVNNTNMSVMPKVIANNVNNTNISAIPKVIENNVNNTNINVIPKVIGNNMNNINISGIPKVIDNNINNTNISTIPKVIVNNVNNPNINAIPKVIGNNMNNPNINSIPKVIGNNINNPNINSIPKVIVNNVNNPNINSIPKAIVNNVNNSNNNAIPKVIVNNVNNPNINATPKVNVSVSLAPVNNPLLPQKNQLNNNILSLNQNLREPYDIINLGEFRVLNEIGEGTFGKIYKVIWMINNKLYALKKEILKDNEGVKIRQHRNEAIRAFTKLTNYRGIVHLYGNLTIPNGHEYLYFELMELCDKDFEKEIKERAAYNRFYTEQELDNIMIQLISTLAFLQKMHITHRDIKPQNILISNGIYKLCDFGDIRVMQREGIVVQRVRGSELYMSPILFQGLRDKAYQVKHNTYKSDVFSLGMVFLLAACLSFDGCVDIREILDMNQKEIILNKHLGRRYSPKFIKILLLMLQTEEINRPDFIVLDTAIKQYGL